MPEAQGQSVGGEVVWKVDWRISQEGRDDEMNTGSLEQMLDGGLILRAPERWMGIPFRHAWSRLNGKWKKAVEQGIPPPMGSASPFDAVMLERSRMLLESRLIRSGHLEGALSMDTANVDGKMTITVNVDPGPRYVCGSTSLKAEGSGLDGDDTEALGNRWARWVGRPLDLDALDRDREALSQLLQSEGWFGLISDHFGINIDTTGSRASRKVHLGLVVSPIVQGEDTLVHRRAIIDSLTFHWHPFDGNGDSLESRMENGILWRVPAGRNVSGMSHRMHLATGDRYNPKQLSEARQSLRQLPLIRDVRVDIVQRDDVTKDGVAPLHVHLDAYPAKRGLMRANGAMISRQGIGGEMALSVADLDFRNRAEQISLDVGLGLETVTPYSSGSDGEAQGPTPLNSRVLSAGVVYSTGRLFPYGPARFPKSNKPESRLSLTLRDENRPSFSRTYVQIGLVEGFVENPATGSKIELRPFEIAVTSSRLQPQFEEDLADLASEVVTSSFQSRALFGSGVDWWVGTPRNKKQRWRWSLNLEFEGAGNLFHLIDPRSPQETTVPLPSIFGETAEVQVARYTRWLLEARGGWSHDGRSGVFGRCFIGAASSSIPGVGIPLEKQFYVGGPNSMRGWQALGLGPGGSDVEGLRVRGDIRLELNLELRQYINDWVQLAAFTDAGNIWMTRPEENRPNVEFAFDTFLSQTAVSYGAGVRLDFDYFLLRCDVGRPWRTPLGSLPTEGSWRIHPAVSVPF